MRVIHVLTFTLALSLLLVGLSLANGSLERPREVLGSGASDSTAGVFSLRATLGQPMAGNISGGSVTLGQGFWHGGVEYRVYLPLVLRN